MPDELTDPGEPDLPLLSGEEEEVIEVSGDEYARASKEEPAESEPAEPPKNEIIEVLAEEADTPPNMRRRRVRRRESTEFTQEERIQIDSEIVQANGNLIETEKEKAAQNKVYNGHISEYRQTLDDAIEVLRKGVFWHDYERIEEFDFDANMVNYYDIETDSFVDSRDMTDEELQTKMKM